ncbi:hypothetical protein LY78DRAFT_332399 [Colletotrichum sublineola]|nr:hypothetical protein LY78DRAFT_332399 [Colletotrichum sublineola]
MYYNNPTFYRAVHIHTKPNINNYYYSKLFFFLYLYLFLYPFTIGLTTPFCLLLGKNYYILKTVRMQLVSNQSVGLIRACVVQCWH